MEQRLKGGGEEEEGEVKIPSKTYHIIHHSMLN